MNEATPHTEATPSAGLIFEAVVSAKNQAHPLGGISPFGFLFYFACVLVDSFTLRFLSRRRIKMPEEKGSEAVKTIFFKNGILI